MVWTWRAPHSDIPGSPVAHDPMLGVIVNRCVTDDGSISLSVIFFCASSTQQSAPRIPMEVRPSLLIALNAYSVWTSGHKDVRTRGHEDTKM